MAAHIEGTPIGTIGGMSGRCTDRFTAVVELSRVVAAAKLHDPEGEGLTKWECLYNAVASPTAMSLASGTSL